MKNIKRKTFLLAALIFIMVLASGCNFHTSKSLTFSVDTGDKIQVSLDTTGGYDMTSDLPFTISCNNAQITQGTFIYASAYEQYIVAVNTDEKAELLDSGTKDGNSYIFWKYDNSEYNYAVLVNGSQTGIILGSNVSQEAAKDCFERLTFSLQK